MPFATPSPRPLLLVSAFALASACGGQAVSSSPSATQSAEIACGAYYDEAQPTFYCGAPPFPAAEVARQRPRFVATCAAFMALPGQGFNPQSLQACTDAIRAEGPSCRAQPSACLGVGDMGGTLPTGTECLQDSQCRTGVCLFSQTASCGVCAAPIPDGQSCIGSSSGSPPGQCAYGSYCLFSPGTSASSATCEPLSLGALGASCDEGAQNCVDGLRCAGGKCTPPGAAGAPCASDLFCAEPLVCLNGTTCVSPLQAGAACSLTGGQDCAADLMCDPATLVCIPVTLASPGESCDGVSKGCLVGACSVPGGVCPTILADGAACTSGSVTTTCDVLATCGSDGKCEVERSRCE